MVLDYIYLCGSVGRYELWKRLHLKLCCGRVVAALTSVLKYSHCGGRGKQPGKMVTETPIEHTVAYVVLSMLRKVGHNGCFLGSWKSWPILLITSVIFSTFPQITCILFKMLFFFFPLQSSACKVLILYTWIGKLGKD